MEKKEKEVVNFKGRYALTADGKSVDVDPGVSIYAVTEDVKKKIELEIGVRKLPTDPLKTN